MPSQERSPVAAAQAGDGGAREHVVAGNQSVPVQQPGSPGTLAKEVDEMSNHPDSTDVTPAEAPQADVFARVLVGVDGSPEGMEAARQAASLLTPAGSLMVVSAYDLAAAVVGGGGMAAPVYDDEASLAERADAALEAARTAISDTTRVTTKRLRGGRPWELLLREAEREHVSAIAVGTHGRGRLRGIVLGSTATELVHKAVCSVLIARAGVTSPPTTVVVGVDGSSGSKRALEVARALCARFGARLRPVVAHGVDVDAVTRVLAGEERFEQPPDEPVTALVAAGADADLVVVGSRGLHGLRALGSVSERVAHEAPCSVLVVR